MAGDGGGWFRVGFQAEEPFAGLEPVRMGGADTIRALRPSWSFVGIVAADGAGPVRLAGQATVALPEDCRDVLPSETHVVLLRKAALEAWRLGAGPAVEGEEPVWRRELRAQEEEATGSGGEPPLSLPLVPDGFVEAQPPAFFHPLSPALRARQLALGYEHALLLSADGCLYSWGAGRHGQLGSGDLESTTEPRPIEALQGVPMVQVAAGGWHSASLGEAGDLYVWGWNESGQLGLPSKGVMESFSMAATAGANSSSSPPSSGAQDESHRAAFINIQAFPALLDMPGGADVGKVSCGSRHTAALTRTGDLYTWGWGKYGQLGRGDTTSSDAPKKVCSFEAWGFKVADVVCGPWTTFALALPLAPLTCKATQKTFCPQ